ncbi:MAG: DUF2510 domain-containing protein [Coriobacteriia bacterium]
MLLDLLLKNSQHPKRLIWIALGPLILIEVLFAIILLLISPAGAQADTPTMVAALVISVLALLDGLWPRLVLSQTKKVAGDPLSLERYFVWIYGYMLIMLMSVPLMGFVCAMIFDPRLFLFSVALSALPAGLWWPTPVRTRRWETYLESRGVVEKANNPQAGWYPDPADRHEIRYWDGMTWTEHVSDQGDVGVDPLAIPTSDA